MSSKRLPPLQLPINSDVHTIADEDDNITNNSSWFCFVLSVLHPLSYEILLSFTSFNPNCLRFEMSSILMSQAKIIFRLTFFNLVWFAIPIVSFMNN